MKFNPPFLDSHILHLYDVMNPSTPQEISRSKSIGPTHVTTGQSHSSDQEQRASDGPNDICDACVGLHELQAYCWGTYTDWVQIMRDLWACETLQYNVGKTTVACVTIGRASAFLFRRGATLRLRYRHTSLPVTVDYDALYAPRGKHP